MTGGDGHAMQKMLMGLFFHCHQIIHLIKARFKFPFPFPSFPANLAMNLNCLVIQ